MGYAGAGPGRPGALGLDATLGRKGCGKAPRLGLTLEPSPCPGEALVSPRAGLGDGAQGARVHAGLTQTGEHRAGLRRPGVGKREHRGSCDDTLNQPLGPHIGLNKTLETRASLLSYRGREDPGGTTQPTPAACTLSQLPGAPWLRAVLPVGPALLTLPCRPAATTHTGWLNSAPSDLSRNGQLGGLAGLAESRAQVPLAVGP